MSALNRWDWKDQSKFDAMLKRSIPIHIRNFYGGVKSNTSKKLNTNKLVIKIIKLTNYCKANPNNLVAKRHMEKLEKKLIGV